MVMSFVASPGQFVVVDLRADQKFGRLLQELAIGLALQALGAHVEVALQEMVVLDDRRHPRGMPQFTLGGILDDDVPTTTPLQPRTLLRELLEHPLTLSESPKLVRPAVVVDPRPRTP